MPGILQTGSSGGAGRRLLSLPWLSGKIHVLHVLHVVPDARVLDVVSLTESPRMLPLIAVITPATLSVQLAAQPNQTTFYAPIPSIDYDYSDIKKWAVVETAGGDGISGPSSRLTRLMTSVASRGSISQISAPYP